MKKTQQSKNLLNEWEKMLADDIYNKGLYPIYIYININSYNSKKKK